MSQNKQELIISELKEKKSSFYFYVPPSNGVPAASISYVYDFVDIMRESGYEAFLIHDKDYKKPMWMGGNYHNLPHIQFEDLKVKASDFLFIPEVYVQPFFSDMNQNGIKLPCEVVVLSQVQNLILHSLDIGAEWYHWGVRNVVTTTEKQKNYISKILRGLDIEVVSPYIHDDFKPSEKPQKPVIIIQSRDKKEGQKLANEFSRKYPHYAWIPFKYLSKMDRADYAKNISECCLAVWVDDISSFGTFPLECMKSGVPVIGKIPNMMPEWMGEVNEGQYKIKDNGIWMLSSFDNMSEYIEKFIDQWLLDRIGDDIYTQMEETAVKYDKNNTKEQIMKTIDTLFERRIERVNRIFEKQNKANIKVSEK